MLDKVRYIVLLRKDEAAAPIFGQAPSDEVCASLQDLLQSRPAARKEGGGFCVSVPLQKSADTENAPSGQIWAIWNIDYVPAVTDLPKVLSNIADISRGFLGAALSNLAKAAAPQASTLLPLIEANLLDLPARKRRNMTILTQRLPDLLAQSTSCASVAVFDVVGDRVRKSWVSDNRLKPVQAQLRAIYQEMLRNGRTMRRVTLSSDAAAEFDAQELLRLMGNTTFDMVFPSQTAGYGLIIVDTAQGDHAAAYTAMMAMLQFSRPISTAPVLSTPRKRVLMGLVAAVAIWLAWPAPTWLTVTGVSLPDSTLAVALPSDATLQQMLVRVGQTVEKGDPIAQLFSAQLQERRSQEELSIKVEELAAQSAMSENDFGAFQLAQQRAEIAKTRLAQIEARLEQLNMVAPAAGLIVSAIPDNTKGTALPQGTTLAEVQTQPKFLVRLNPARVDARLLQVGQTGKIYFRGLSDRTYDVQITTPPVARINPNTRAETLESYAVVTTPDDGRLMAGLSGYARVAAPRQIRIMSLTRHMREYVRVVAWNYLGLRL